jgi:membrane-bound ClpP family serine protease
MDPLLLWGLALLGIALLIVGIDIFIPTAGVLAITSLVVAVAGVVLLFRYDTAWGIAGAGLVIVGGPALFALGLRIFPQTPIGRKLILGADADDDADRAPPPPDPMLKLIGTEGITLTDLRPVGVIRVGTAKFDALSETTFVRPGQPVRITGVEGPTLKVRPIDPA